jgi:hypothetical protein
VLDTFRLRHSMGGAIARLTELYHPEHLAGLVLVDTGARLGVDPVLLRDAREAVLRGRSTGSDRAWAFAQSTPQEVVNAVHALTEGGDWIADDTFDVMSCVTEIRVPTLAVCGAADRMTPVKYHRFLEARIPGCRLTITSRPDTGCSGSSRKRSRLLYARSWTSCHDRRRRRDATLQRRTVRLWRSFVPQMCPTRAHSGAFGTKVGA